MAPRADSRPLPVWLISTLMAGSWGTAASQTADLEGACDAPRSCIEFLHRGLIELSLEGAEADLEARYAGLEPLITATHDLPLIARFSVRRQWPEFSMEEREAFVRAFVRLSVMTYAVRFVGLSDVRFRILESGASDGERTQVVASIVREAQPDIPMEYVLQQEEGSWRIVNVIADGVSDLALKRAEYRRILMDGSPADLIAYLERQTADLM